MRKIRTIFERAQGGKVIDLAAPGVSLLALAHDKTVKATEKLDGTNVRITVRNHTMIRAEKRRNPDKIQKQKGIIEPWYVDADPYSPQDKYIYDGISHTDFSIVEDGEHSGELLGPDIQGNPLNLPHNRILFFNLGQAPVFENVPTGYNELREWLKAQKSKYGTDCGIEGIVWHFENGEMYKIKTKDF